MLSRRKVSRRQSLSRVHDEKREKNGSEGQATDSVKEFQDQDNGDEQYVEHQRNKIIRHAGKKRWRDSRRFIFMLGAFLGLMLSLIHI